MKHLTAKDIEEIINKIKTKKTYYINFEFVDQIHKATGPRRMVSVLENSSIQLPEKQTRVVKEEIPAFKPKAEYFEKPVKKEETIDIKRVKQEKIEVEI